MLYIIVDTSLYSERVHGCVLFFLYQPIYNMSKEIDEIVELQQNYLAAEPVYTNFRAWTSNSNNELTDLQEHVPHTVAYEENGRTKEIEILAQCPLDAISHVHEFLTNQ